MRCKAYFTMIMLLAGMAGMPAYAQSSVKPASLAPPFNGLGTNMENLYRLSDAQSRSISAENFTGEKGKGGMAKEGSASHAARELGQGWKVNPFVRIKPHETFTLANIQGSGAIQQIWICPTPTDQGRLQILRFYWDGEAEPSVEVPIGDFFASGWGNGGKSTFISSLPSVNSLAICVNPGSGFNSYWLMPFHKSAKVTIENIDDKELIVYYQINYTLTDVPADAACFHAQFRRVHKLPFKTDYTILDGVRGQGQYVGTYMAWEVRSPGWWGEGEIKFFLDGDREFPTICGTGTEDYFCGSYNFEDRRTKLYQPFCTPYAGLVQVIPSYVSYQVGQRFGMYRWHIVDPIRFQKDLRVTMQALGWQTEGRYLPLEDDIASVAYWYQAEPHAKFPTLPSKEELIIKPQTVIVKP